MFASTKHDVRNAGSVYTQLLHNVYTLLAFLAMHICVDIPIILNIISTIREIFIWTITKSNKIKCIIIPLVYLNYDNILIWMDFMNTIVLGKPRIFTLVAFPIRCLTGYKMVNEFLVSTNFIKKATQTRLVKQAFHLNWMSPKPNNVGSWPCTFVKIMHIPNKKNEWNFTTTTSTPHPPPPP